MNVPSSLVCRELRLRQFRNFAELDLRFPPPGAAVIGPNGSGKTNLIEALYYLEIFRSFRGAGDDQLVRFGGEAFHIRGRFEDPETGREVEVTAGYETRRKKKVVTVDGAEVERLGEGLGRIGAVVFSPSDVGIVAGAPGERRRFLDIVLSLNVRGYLGALQRYRHVLRQRNALLRAGAPAGQVEPWTATLVETGAVVMAARAAWVAEHRDGFARRCERIGGEASVRLEYVPSVTGTESPESDFAASLGGELERLAVRERDRGVTLAGPHRDDLAFLREGGEGGEGEGSGSGGERVDLRDYGSGGQQRTAAVALRLVEAETIRRSRDRAPLILLDDIFAELDPGRSARLLELLDEEPGQAILTAPKASDVEVRQGVLPRWRIAGGQIVAAA